MILRKPYALLIKNFKRIHIVLCILMVYIAYESHNILVFFNQYINTGTFTRTSFSLASTYINIYMFVVTVLIAAISLIIYILMRQKHKPKLIYFIMIALYLGMIIFFFQIYNVLDVIDVSSISPRSIRIIRDLSSIVCYAQYVMTVIIAIRAVGFNIKKFNFGEDLAELQIDVTDNEEFELTVGIDQDKLQRSVRRTGREIKYFIVENLFILLLISFAVLLSIVIVIILNKEIYNKIYSQNESFKANYFVETINNSYYTHLNQRGDKAAPTGKAYIVTTVTFNNQAPYAQQLSMDSINLISNNIIYAPVITLYQLFADLGVGYTNQIIKPNTASTFMFVFEVNDNININKLIFRYTEDLKITSTRLEAKYKKVALSPKVVDTIKTKKEVKLGDYLTFKDSALDNTKVKINNFEIADKFTYDATSCYDEQCYTSPSNLTLEYTTPGKFLMKLSFDYTSDTKLNLLGASSLDDVIDNYGFIRYVIGLKTYESSIVDETPSNYVGNDLYYQVPKISQDAKDLSLIFRVRDKEYIYNLK